jgi:rhodanese-related sulfurtransferase
MAITLTSLGDAIDLGFDDIIDVRSPSEWADDHIPGAISLPVLDDAERARVGTIYKQESPFTARKVGAALVAQNAARHLQGPLADKPGSWRPLVYCWRGGQRSGSFATILSQVGWRVETVAGGYKTWRCAAPAQAAPQAGAARRPSPASNVASTPPATMAMADTGSKAKSASITKVITAQPASPPATMATTPAAAPVSAARSAKLPRMRPRVAPSVFSTAAS